MIDNIKLIYTSCDIGSLLKSSNLNSSDLNVTNTPNTRFPTKEGLCGLNHKTPSMLKSKSEINLIEF